jgi:hypothetical protein
VPLTYSDRTIVAQGLVTNTLGIVKDRTTGSSSQFAYPDYLLRTNDKKKSESDSNVQNGSYCHYDVLRQNNAARSPSEYNSWERAKGEPDPRIEIMANGGTVTDNYTTIYDISSVGDKDLFFIDRNTVNFWSPEVTYNSDISKPSIDACTRVSLYGFAFVTSQAFKFDMDAPNLNGKIDRSIGNYTTPYIDQVNKSMFKTVYSEPSASDSSHTYREMHNIPMWSPENYSLRLPQRNAN